MNTDEAIKVLEALQKEYVFIDEPEYMAIDHAIEVLKASQWRNISSAPRDGTRVLACNRWGETWSVYWCRNKFYAYKCDDDWYSVYFEEGELTHWMPRPPAPKEGE